MMKKSPVRPLRLSTETVRSLDARALQGVAGASVDSSITFGTITSLVLFCWSDHFTHCTSVGGGAKQ
jgi:hypothetical protein